MNFRDGIATNTATIYNSKNALRPENMATITIHHDRSHVHIQRHSEGTHLDWKKFIQYLKTHFPTAQWEVFAQSQLPVYIKPHVMFMVMAIFQVYVSSPWNSVAQRLTSSCLLTLTCFGYFAIVIKEKLTVQLSPSPSAWQVYWCSAIFHLTSHYIIAAILTAKSQGQSSFGVKYLWTTDCKINNPPPGFTLWGDFPYIFIGVTLLCLCFINKIHFHLCW